MGIRDLKFEDIKVLKDFCEKVLGLIWTKGNKNWPPRAVGSNSGTLASVCTFSKNATVDISSMPRGSKVTDYESYCRYVYAYLQWLYGQMPQDDAGYRERLRVAMRFFSLSAQRLLSTQGAPLSDRERTALNTFVGALQRWIAASENSATSAPPATKPAPMPPAPRKPAERPRAAAATMKPAKSKSPGNLTVSVRYRLNSRSEKDIAEKQVSPECTLGAFVEQIRASELPAGAVIVSFDVADDDTDSATRVAQLASDAVIDIVYKIPKAAPKPKNPAPRAQKITYRYTVDPDTEIHLWTTRDNNCTVSVFLDSIYESDPDLDAYEGPNDLRVLAAGNMVDRPNMTLMRDLDTSQPLVIRPKMLAFEYSIKGDEQTGDRPLPQVLVPINAGFLAVKNQIAIQLCHRHIKCRPSRLRLSLARDPAVTLTMGLEVRKFGTSGTPIRLEAEVRGYPPVTSSSDSDSSPSCRVNYRLMDEQRKKYEDSSEYVPASTTFRELKSIIKRKYRGKHHIDGSKIRIFAGPNSVSEMNDDTEVGRPRCTFYYIMIENSANSKPHPPSVHPQTEDTNQKPKTKKKTETPTKPPKKKTDILKEVPKKKDSRKSKTPSTPKKGAAGTATAEATRLTYRYTTNLNTNIIHTIELDTGATVKDFKKRLADKYDVRNPADIKVAFAGKDLLSDLVLEELNIDDTELFVYIRSTADIFLGTAKALRVPSNSDDRDDSE